MLTPSTGIFKEKIGRNRGVFFKKYLFMLNPLRRFLNKKFSVIEGVVFIKYLFILTPGDFYKIYICVGTLYVDFQIKNNP